MEDLVSIVVPVYNAENTICKLIESLFKQTHKNLEIIIIDDGSTDNTLKNIQKLNYNDKRLRVFTKKNEGVSIARNFGIERASGTFITFVDADDLLYENSIQELLNELISNDADLTIGLHKKSNVEHNNTSDFNERLIPININQVKFNILYPGKGNKFSSFNFRTVWGKLYKLQIIRENSIKFPVNLKLFEDGLFNLVYLEHINKVNVFQRYVYYYNISDTSAVHKVYKDISAIFNRIKYHLNLILEQHEKSNHIYIKYMNLCLFEFVSQMLINNFKLGIKTKRSYVENKLQIDEVLLNTNPKMLTVKHKVLFYLLKFKLFGMVDLLVSIK